MRDDLQRLADQAKEDAKKQLEEERAPSCELTLEGGRPVLTCESDDDQKVMYEALKGHDLTVRVRPRDEGLSG